MTPVLFTPLTPPRPLALGFLCPHDPYDRRTFSGTPFHAARALAARDDIELRILGDYRPPRLTDRLRAAPGAPEVSRLDLAGLDAVVGLVATPLLDALTARAPELPVFHVTDATPAFLRDVYGWRVPETADAAEARVAARAACTVYSSQEMADRAAHDLGLPAIDAAVAPFGVNFEHLPGHCPEKPSLNQLDLLFVGADWERKGGDIAIAALDRLRAAGRAAQLTVVGRCPERYRSHPGVTYAGFLNKNRRRDATRLRRLYGAAHLLVLPSRADCTPMVIAEAMAHGTPVVATDTGGVRSQIGGDGAGRCLPPFATPDTWAETIAALTRDRTAYEMLSDASFERAATVLSWDSWAETIGRLAGDAVFTDRTPRRIGAAGRLAAAS